MRNSMTAITFSSLNIQTAFFFFVHVDTVCLRSNVGMDTHTQDVWNHGHHKSCTVLASLPSCLAFVSMESLHDLENFKIGLE